MSFENFYKSLAAHRQKQRRATEEENAELWAILTDLLGAVIQEEVDGRKIIDLKEYAKGRADELLLRLT